MYLRLNKKITSVLFFLVLAAFLSLNVMGPAHAFGMQKNENGQMSGCVFDGMAEICTMSLLEHMAAWQSLFTANVPNNTLTAALASLLLFAIAFAFVRRLWPSDPVDLILTGQKIHNRFRQDFTFVNPLQEAFSNGILNPKLF